MLNNAYKSIARERASIQRIMEYTENMDSDDVVEESFLSLDAKLSGDNVIKSILNESALDDDEDITECIAQMSCESTEDEEIERILNSKTDMTIDDVMGTK